MALLLSVVAVVVVAVFCCMGQIDKIRINIIITLAVLPLDPRWLYVLDPWLLEFNKVCH